MSKMDNLRAMREARYAEAAARAAKPTQAAGTAKPPTAPASTTARPPTAEPEVPAGQETEALCGHRNMSGRTCTREQGHAAKSHRYS
jgi:hypothetical protein